MTEPDRRGAECRVGHTIEGRIEERAETGSAPGGARELAVEGIAERAHQEQEPAHEGPVRREDGCAAERHDETGRRDGVGRDTEAGQAARERREQIARPVRHGRRNDAVTHALARRSRTVRSAFMRWPARGS